MTADDVKWIEHKYLYTYRLASKVQEFAEGNLAHSGELESLIVDFGIAEFIPPWQKDSALHKFIRFVADGVMESDNSGGRMIPLGGFSQRITWTLPIEVALVTYGLQGEIQFELSEIPQVYERIGNTTYARDASELSDACYGHFQRVRCTQGYADLLQRLSDEVFYIMFTNRRALQRLNEYLAYYVTESDYGFIVEAHPEVAKHYTKSGRLHRKRPPKWVRRAIFFRDHGMCATCKRDVTGLVDPLGVENYDHIVPLDAGGLNDVTNIQLLCESCNNKKSSRREPASNNYRRWY